MVHAIAEVRDVGLAYPGSLVRLVDGVLAVILLGDGLVDRRCGSLRAPATEKASYRVADGRADGDTTASWDVSRLKLRFGIGYVIVVKRAARDRWGEGEEKGAYAAVLAIWPKRPDPPLC